MKKYRLIIDSESDFDYNLNLSLQTLGNHFNLKNQEDEFKLTADFHLKSELEFCNKLYEIFNEFKIDSNKEYLVSQFNTKLNELLLNLSKNKIVAQYNWFGGNQDLMIIFLEITHKELGQ